MNATFEWRRIFDRTIYCIKAAIVAGTAVLAIHAALFVAAGDFAARSVITGVGSRGCVALLSATAAGWFARRRKIEDDG